VHPSGGVLRNGQLRTPYLHFRPDIASGPGSAWDSEGHLPLNHPQRPAPLLPRNPPEHRAGVLLELLRERLRVAVHRRLVVERRVAALAPSTRRDDSIQALRDVGLQYPLVLVRKDQSVVVDALLLPVEESTSRRDQHVNDYEVRPIVLPGHLQDFARRFGRRFFVLLRSCLRFRGSLRVR
jgi:hypothetical protein